MGHPAPSEPAPRPGQQNHGAGRGWGPRLGEEAGVGAPAGTTNYGWPPAAWSRARSWASWASAASRALLIGPVTALSDDGSTAAAGAAGAPGAAGDEPPQELRAAAPTRAVRTVAATRWRREGLDESFTRRMSARWTTGLRREAQLAARTRSLSTLELPPGAMVTP